MKTSQEQLVEQIVKQIQEQILSEEFGKPSRATNCEDYQSSTTNKLAMLGQSSVQKKSQNMETVTILILII